MNKIANIPTSTILKGILNKFAAGPLDAFPTGSPFQPRPARRELVDKHDHLLLAKPNVPRAPGQDGGVSEWQASSLDWFFGSGGNFVNLIEKKYGGNGGIFPYVPYSHP